MDLCSFLKLYEYDSLRKGRPGAFPLLRPRAALRCILEGSVRGFRFEGVEGFILRTHEQKQPNQGVSFDRADYENESDFVTSVVEAVLTNLDLDNIAFEVVFAEKKAS